MRKAMSVVQNMLLRQGFILQRTNPSASIESLLELIWPVETKIPLKRIGSETRSDGGYLVPDDLDGIGRVFSPGVAESMDFELHFLDKGVPCELIDGSIEAPPIIHPLANFAPLWLSRESKENSVSLSDWVDNKAQEHEDLVLQMDIEGDEYECLSDVSTTTLGRFRIIVLEVHHLREAFSFTGFATIDSLVTRLKQTHYLIHAHPNNCCPAVKVGKLAWPAVLELTFLRKDRMSLPTQYANLPHPLDRDNTSNPHLRMSPGKFFRPNL